MTKPNPARLYATYYIERQSERIDLFEALSDRYASQSVLYPGSFVHVTPSMVYPTVVYVDADKQARRFFSDPSNYDFINGRKQYEQDASVTFHAADYREALPEPDARFDLLISQYAGFISQYCKRYLRIGGMLLANDSHGDASMAFLDEDYQLVGVVLEVDGKCRVSEANIDTYFVAKAGKTPTKAGLEATQRGAAYQKNADAYLFRRVG